MRSRPVAVLLAGLLAAVTAVVVTAVTAAADMLEQSSGDGHRRTVGRGQIRFDGHGPEWWAVRWRREHRAAAELRRQLRHIRYVLVQRPSVVEAINLAAVTYGDGRTLWRKARCETGGSFSSRAYNSSSGAAGLFQFLPSTWNTTPYRGFSVYSAYAASLAAGWMHAHGRGSEWSCP